MKLPQSRTTSKTEHCGLSIADCRFDRGLTWQLAIANRQFILLLIVCCCLLPSAACNSTDMSNSNETPVISGQPKTNPPMPPLRNGSVTSLGWETDGKHSVISDYKGRVLILDFYATWCGPCRDSIPHLVGLHKKYEGQGLSVIGLNVGGPGDPEKAPGFAKEFNIQYPLAMPDDDLVRFMLSHSEAIPQTYVFDREGKLAEHLIGFDAASGAQLDQAVEAALQISAP